MIVSFFQKGSDISDSLIKSLANSNESFEFMDDGDLKIYLSEHIKKYKYGPIEVTQSYLLEWFIELVDQEKNINVKTTQATKSLLHKDIDGLEI